MIQFFKSLFRLVRVSGDAVDGMGAETTILLKHVNDILSQPGVKENLAATLEATPQMIKSVTETVEQTRPKLIQNLDQIIELTGHANRLTSCLSEQVENLVEQKTFDRLNECVQKLPKTMDSVEKLLEEQVTPTLSETQGLLKESRGSLKDLGEVLEALKPALETLKPDAGTMVSRILHEDTLLQRTDDFLTACTALMVMIETQPTAFIFGNRTKKKA
jgi:ABC-type transporter Mla subunit MlaD